MTDIDTTPVPGECATPTIHQIVCQLVDRRIEWDGVDGAEAFFRDRLAEEVAAGEDTRFARLCLDEIAERRQGARS